MSNGGQRRRSIFGGILLILIGVLFLMRYHFPGLGIGHLMWRFWPLLLILWGVARLYDHFAAQRQSEKSPPIITGGEVVLLLLLALIVAGMASFDWVRRENPDLDISGGIFDKTVSTSEEIPATPVKPGSRIRITLGRGNITIHAEETGKLNILLTKTATASSESEAQKRLQQAALTVNPVADGYEVVPRSTAGDSGGLRLNLDIHLPKQVSVIATTDRGDINISDIAGAVSATTQNGDVEIHDAGADVSAELQHGDVRITGVRGNVRLSGRGNEVELGDISGDATISGEFFGPVRVRNVTKTTHYTSSRTDLTILQLTGRMEMDSGSLEISDAPGNVSLQTRDKNVTLENIGGRLQIVNRHGDIQVQFRQPPRAEVTITNDSGGVDLTLPANSSFELAAVSRSGEIESDFENPELKSVQSDETTRLEGKLGTHGPQIHLTTSYGTIEIHKGS